MSARRVVISGLGVIAPNGIGKEEFWQANIAGKSGVENISVFDTTQLESKIYAPVKDFSHLDYIPQEDYRKLDRFVHLGLASAKTAIVDSKLDLGKEECE